MRLTERDHVLIISDRPTLVWLLGLWFVVGGAVAMLMTFVAVNVQELHWWERVLAFAIGAGVFAGGVFTIHASPRTTTVLNRVTGRAHVRIRGLRRGEDLVFACRDVIVVEMREEKDSDGDPCWQLRLGLRSGRVLPLHATSRHGREWCEEQRRRIRRFLELA